MTKKTVADKKVEETIKKVEESKLTVRKLMDKHGVMWKVDTDGKKIERL